MQTMGAVMGPMADIGAPDISRAEGGDAHTSTCEPADPLADSDKRCAGTPLPSGTISSGGPAADLIPPPATSPTDAAARWPHGVSEGTAQLVLISEAHSLGQETGKTQQKKAQKAI